MPISGVRWVPTGNSMADLALAVPSPKRSLSQDAHQDGARRSVRLPRCPSKSAETPNSVTRKTADRGGRPDSAPRAEISRSVPVQYGPVALRILGRYPCRRLLNPIGMSYVPPWPGAAAGSVNPPASASRCIPVRISSVRGRVRYAGFGRTKIRVTDGHETEAKAEQLHKGPNRIGLFFLRLLGFRGVVAPPISQRHVGPSHEHPVHPVHPDHHEHSASSSGDGPD